MKKLLLFLLSFNLLAGTVTKSDSFIAKDSYVIGDSAKKYTTFVPQTMSSNQTYYLPTTPPVGTQVFTCNAAGYCSWSSGTLGYTPANIDQTTPQTFVGTWTIPTLHLINPLSDTYILNSSTWNNKQAGSLNLTSISGLNYSTGTPFVVMTGVNTFGFDTTTYVPTSTTVNGHALTGNISVTKSDVGLSNVTDDKQVKGLSAGTTVGHFVAFGTDGYTIADSGYTGSSWITTESDPIFSNSNAASITSTDISNWNGKLSSISGTNLDNVWNTNGILVRTGAATYSTITDNSSNWNDAYTYRLTSASGNSPLTLTLGTNSLTGSISQSNSNTNGYLSYTDWNTFNSKQPAGNYITLSSLSATAPITYNSATGGISTSMATGKLLGRATALTGVAEEITLGTNLSFTGTTLNAATQTQSDWNQNNNNSVDYIKNKPGNALLLDQTTPQTVINGIPTFNLGIVSNVGTKTPSVFPATDTTSAFQIRQADNVTPVLTADTTNSMIQIGTAANSTDYPKARLVVSQADSTHTYAFNLGVVGEAVGSSVLKGVGVGGVSLLGGTKDVFGTFGRAKVGATAYTGDAIGLKGASEETHAGGRNIGVYSIAKLGNSNYSFYGEAGDIYNNGNINIPTGSAYKINNNNLSYSDVGAQVAGTYVTSVTGTAPIVSSNGTTPAISITSADATHAGSVPLSGTPTNNQFLRSTTTTGAVSWENVSDNDIYVNPLGTPTYKTLRDYITNTTSSGKVSGGALAAVDATHISIAAGTGYIKTTNSSTGTTVSFDWSANNNLLITTGSVNYIYIDYNSGTPIIAATTTESNINRNTQIPIGACYGDGSENPHVFTDGVLLNNWITNEQHRLLEVRRSEHASGAEVGATGTRNISLTTGIFYVAGTRTVFPPFDSSGADKFRYVYSNGLGGWTDVINQTQIDNTHYDNGTGTLATLSSNRYGVHWVYILADNTIYIKYGIGDYTLAQAQAAQIPASMPNELTQFGVPAAKIIIQKSSATFNSIISAYTTPFGTTAPSDHSTLSNLDYANAGHTGFQATLTNPVTGPTTNTADYIPQWDGANSKLLKDGLAVGTSANNIVQLDASGYIPQVVGTNIAGMIQAWAGVAVPTGWLNCDGSSVSMTTYATLWAALSLSQGEATISNATPVVVTLNGHGRATGDAIYFTTTGALPAPLAVSTTYYVIYASSDTFNLATTYANALAGTKINTTNAGSGTHTLIYAPYGIASATNFYLPDFRSATIRGVGTPTRFTSNTVVGLGNPIDDKFQGHTFVISNDTDKRLAMEATNTTPAMTGVDNNASVISARKNYNNYMIPGTDGTNGTPRIGLETTSKAIGAFWIIKY